MGAATNGVLALAVALAPPLVFSLWAWQQVQARLDRELAQSKPLIELELSEVLQRPVHFQRLSPGLSIATLKDALTRKTLPVVVEGLELGCRPDEQRWAGQSWLVRVPRVSALVSPAALQAGKLSEHGVADIRLEAPEVVVYRRPDGHLSFEDFLPKPKTPPDPSQPAFQTTIGVHAGRVRVRDFASLRAPGQVEENALQRVDALADLTGTRTIRFTARAYPAGRTTTRLLGPLLVEGSARRGAPGPRDDSPRADQPLVSLRASAESIELPYWASYAVKLPPQAALTRGRAKVQASLLLPPEKEARPIVHATARFFEVDGQLQEATRVPFTGLGGSATYDGETLTVVVAGKALGESFTLQGSLRDLTSPNPQVAATVRIPRVPLRRGLALLPKVKLPPKLALGETLQLEGARITGTLQAPQVQARISGIQASWKGFPTVTASANLVYTNQELRATEIRANFAGGGTLVGQGSYTLKSQQGAFDLHLRAAPLESVALLKGLKTPPRGQLSGDVAGTILRDTITGDGLIQVANLSLAGLSFPNASARLSLKGKRYQLLDGALAGESGALRVTGSGELGGAMALEGQLVAADLGKLTRSFGLPGVGGTVSASLQLTGTEAAPSLLLRDVTVLQPSFRFDSHLLIAESAFIERTTLRLLSTGQVRLELDPMQPLRVSHSPAVAEVYGTITGSKEASQLNLVARAENIEVDEILQQLSDEPGNFAPLGLQHHPTYESLLTGMEWTGVPKPPISGLVRSAQATITGDAKEPVILGKATLGRFLLTRFPLEGGTLAFSRDENQVRVHDIQLNTATGAVSGELSLAKTGALTGAVVAQSIDLEALSSLGGLEEKRVGITGAVSATLTLAGTSERPLITAQLAEKRPLQLVGIPVTELQIGALELAPILGGPGPVEGIVTLPEVSLRLGKSRVKFELLGVHYDLATQRVTGRLAVTEARLQQVLDDLRSAHLDDTPEGQDFIQSLYKVPSQIDGTAALTGTVGASFATGSPTDLSANLRLSSGDLVFQAGTEKEPVVVKGQLNARATLSNERLSLDNAELILQDPQSEDPTIVRLLAHATKDPKTGETSTSKSWLRLPQTKDEKLEYHLTLDTNAVPLNLVRVLSPRSLPPIQGKAAVTLAADGTAETPHVTASFYADNLLIGETVGQAGAVNIPPLVVDLLRFQVELTGKNARDWQLTLTDGRLTHAKEVVTFDGALPYDNQKSRVAADQPIQAHAAIDDAQGLTLATLTQYFQTGGIKLGGVLRGNLQLAGSLNEPQLTGKLRLDDGTARFPNPIQRGARDVINPIQHLALAMEFAGNEIRFPKAELQLAQLPPTKSEKGKPLPTLPALDSLPRAGKLSLDPSSVIRLENLEDFTRLFARKETDQEERAPAPKLRGEFDLKASFENLQLDTENASALLMNETLVRSLGGGLEEAFKGQFNGRFLVRGPLLTPTLATATGGNLGLTDVSFRLPKRQLPESAENVARDFNPRFALNLETINQARLTKTSVFEFQGLGNVTISGDLASPKIEGVLSPTGGYFKYPLATFTVQRGGELRLTYAKRYEARQDRLQFDLKAQDVTASGKILVSSSAVKSSQSTPTTFDPGRLSNQIPDDLAGKRVTITASFNGVLPLGDALFQVGKSQANPIRLTASDPRLSEYAIYSLLFPVQMFSQLSEQALRDGASLLSNGLTSSLLTPLTDQFSKLFGLENVSLDYGQDGLANLFFIRRLPEPLDKVTIEVRRSFQTRSGSSTLLPQLYSLNYEIGQLRRGSRLQLGASTNEQRDSQLFIRGTLRY